MDLPSFLRLEVGEVQSPNRVFASVFNVAGSVHDVSTMVTDART